MPSFLPALLVEPSSLRAGQGILVCQDSSSCLVLEAILPANLARQVVDHFGMSLSTQQLIAICRWVPVKERSRSLALVYSGMYTGSIFGLALSPHMVEVLSWPSVFYIFGAVGILWFVIWQSQAASSPSVDPRISKEERNYIEETSVLAVSTPCMVFLASMVLNP